MIEWKNWAKAFAVVAGWFGFVSMGLWAPDVGSFLWGVFIDTFSPQTRHLLLGGGLFVCFVLLTVLAKNIYFDD